MNKICGYNCEHNKGGVCQITVCDRKLIMSDKTEVQMPTRYIDDEFELDIEFEERTKMYQNAYKYGQRMEDVTITLKAEQKEFIKYLEDKISKQKNDIFANVLISEDINLYIMKIKLQELEEILQKYKSIIGVSDETN